MKQNYEEIAWSHGEDIETIRRALLAADNTIQADAIMGDDIMNAARADAGLAEEMVAAIPHPDPETEEEVDMNAEVLWMLAPRG